MIKKDDHFITVVIPTKGRPIIKNCLASLRKQTRAPDEIIIIKDEEKRGVSWGRNEGIKKAKGDLIAFTDDDIIAPENWLETLFEAIDHHDAAGAGGYCKETDSLLNDIRALKPIRMTTHVDINGWAGMGGNVMYKKSWIEKCQKEYGHMFNESYLTGEDQEFAFRLRQLGGKLIFVPIPVIHLKHVDLIKYLNMQIYRGRGIAALYLVQKKTKHREGMRKSLLWTKNKDRTVIAWWLIIRDKILGPFNAKHFSTIRNYFVYWLGEKVQILGFLYEMIKMHIDKETRL